MTTTTFDATSARRPDPPELTPQAELALLARSLHRQGYDDQLAGHITYRQPDGTMLVNPLTLTWDEITASDILRIDSDGELLEGRWDVTRAIALHVEFHARRTDAHVALHNHPRWGTLWADLHEVPPIFDQTGALVADGIAMYRDYGGPVADRSPAAAAVDALGDQQMALLGNHGVFVVAPDISTAYLRACTLEWRCRQAWHLRAVGGGIPMHEDAVQDLARRFAAGGYSLLWWESAVRREIRLDRSVLA